jgi:predicted 3-demethylubiquinone-9 3-methyltransferase (glyoxalase superfamily)
MQTRFQRITPFLWFDREAEQAAELYTAVFPNSRIVSTTRHGKASAELSGMPEGAAMTVAFQLDGQDFTALNGGPLYRFSEAISLVVHCRSQGEVDHYWARLSEGGQEQACGWLKDRFGVSWQVVPTALPELLGHADPDKARRAAQAMMTMKKLDIAMLRAAAG